MGTTAEKLTYLNTTKQNLKTVINTTGAGLTNESTFRSYANVLNDKILGAINGDVDLFEEYPKVSGNGTDLSLNGVVEGKMSITPQGVSSQESTTGKNLLNVDSNLEFTRSKTLQVNIPAGTYHITNNGTTASDSSNRVTIRFNTNNKIYALSTSTDYTVTLTSDETTIYLFSHTDYPTSAGVSATIKDLMLSVDGGAYEPYTGGIPAPNPSYPYPVKNVTGENSLAICGENLFSAMWQQGAINTNTGVNYNSSDIIRTQGFLYVTPNQHYSFYRSKIGGYVNLRCYDNNKNYIGTGTDGANLIQGNTLAQPMGNNDYSCVLSFKENVKYVRLMDSTNDLTVQYTMVKGDTPLTSYVANQSQTYSISLGNIELNSTPDGTIRDYIYGTPDNWFKREYIGKVVLDGSENWVNDGGNAPYRISIDGSLITTDNNTLPNVLINRFKTASYNSSWSAYSSLAVPDEKYYSTRLKFRYTAITSLADWKSWLSENNVTVYYLKSQYTDIPITDTTLINQLNDIYNNAHSYNGTTNITTTYEDGNEQMYLDIEALKNVWEVTE